MYVDLQVDFLLIIIVSAFYYLSYLVIGETFTFSQHIHDLTWLIKFQFSSLKKIKRQTKQQQQQKQITLLKQIHPIYMMNFILRSQQKNRNKGENKTETVKNPNHHQTPTKAEKIPLLQYLIQK